MNAQKLRLYFELQRTAHVLKQAADQSIQDKAGVSTAQAAVLLLVATKRDAKQNEIAESLGQREAAMTQMVARLIDKGLLKRHRSSADPRAWQLSLTNSGEESAKAAQVALDDINQRLDRALPQAKVTRNAKATAAFATMLATVRAEFTDD